MCQVWPLKSKLHHIKLLFYGIRNEAVEGKYTLCLREEKRGERTFLGPKEKLDTVDVNPLQTESSRPEDSLVHSKSEIRFK